MKDIGFAFSPFDLFAGLTLREVENLSINNPLFFFVCLLACLWLVRALKNT